MRFARAAFFICVLVGVILAATGFALAEIRPGMEPMVMVSDTFDDGLVPANMTVTQIAPLPGQGGPSPVVWGPIAQSHAGDTGYGLWCAGAAVGVHAPYWPTYPVDTRTLATIDLPSDE